MTDLLTDSVRGQLRAIIHDFQPCPTLETTMEFFATAAADWTAESLQRHLTGPRLSALCASIDRVLHWDDSRDQGEIYCLWGQFQVRRECIRGGVRFTLPTCPNALAWTLTAQEDAAPAGTGVLIHATINRTEHDPDFIESIKAFVEDWRVGLLASIRRMKA